MSWFGFQEIDWELVGQCAAYSYAYLSAMFYLWQAFGDMKYGWFPSMVSAGDSPKEKLGGRLFWWFANWYFSSCTVFFAWGFGVFIGNCYLTSPVLGVICAVTLISLPIFAYVLYRKNEK